MQKECINKTTKSKTTSKELFKMIDDVNKKYIPVKSNKKNKEICPCAVKLTTKKKSLELINKGITIYIREEIINGKTKNIPYKKCSQPCYKDSDSCWKHTQNSDTSINFQHELIDHIGEGVREATLTDDFFKDSSKNSKKLTSLEVSTKPKISIQLTNEIRDAILKATEKKAELESIVASMMDSDDDIDATKDDIPKDDSEEPDDDIDATKDDIPKDDSEDDSEEPDDDIDATKDDIPKDDSEEPDDDIDATKDDSEDDSEEPEDDIENVKTVIGKKSSSKSDDSDDDNSDNDNSDDDNSDEETELESISTKDGKKLMIDNKKNVYEIEDVGDDEEYTEIGELMTCTSTYAPIFLNGKNYIVGEEIYFKGKEYIRCVITGFAYRKRNELLEFVGNTKSNGDGTYKIVVYDPSKNSKKNKNSVKKV
jgi:hypothetical protein